MSTAVTWNCSARESPSRVFAPRSRAGWSPKSSDEAIKFTLLFALCGLTLYLDRGHLVYHYNMMNIEQDEARSAKPLAAGKHTIVVDTTIAGPGKPGTAVVTVDGREIGRAELKRTVPAAFTASESLDIGLDLGSTVSLSYREKRPFESGGEISPCKHAFEIAIQSCP